MGETVKLWLFKFFVRVLHKKFSQSLRVSLKNPFSWKLLKIGPISISSIIRNVGLPAPIPPTDLTTKVVYSVRYSWHGQTFAPKCMFTVFTILARWWCLVDRWFSFLIWIFPTWLLNIGISLSVIFTL